MTDKIETDTKSESQSLVKEFSPGDSAIIIHQDGMHGFHLGSEAPDWHARTMAMLMYFINSEGDENVEAVRERFFGDDPEFDPAKFYDELCEKYCPTHH